MGSSKAQIVISSEPIYFCYRNRNFQCPVSDCLIATSLVWFHRRSVESLRFLPRIDSTLGISLRFSSLDPISLSTQLLKPLLFPQRYFCLLPQFQKEEKPPHLWLSLHMLFFCSITFWICDDQRLLSCACVCWSYILTGMSCDSLL